MWNTILLASIIVVALKLVGYLVPQSLLEKPTVMRISSLLTVALLAALIVVQTIGDGQAVRVDARLPAVIVAAVLFAVRVPFIVVIIAAAATAAGLRALF
jgi:hypothetical protein